MIQPSTQPPEATGGAVPQDQAMGGQSPKLPPEQIAALRQDPEIIEAVSKFMGKKVSSLESIPDNLLIQIAGMVHKLGVDGAIKEFERLVPQNHIADIRGASNG